MQSVWTEDKVKDSILKLNSSNFYLGGGHVREEYPSLYDAARRIFGSWKLALENTGISYKERAIRWNQERIVSEIENLDKNGKAFVMFEPKLYESAQKEFDFWGQALESVNIDDEKHTVLEHVIASELLVLKTINRIKSFEYRVPFPHNKKWICNFLISLNNGTELWLEINNPDKQTEPNVLKLKHIKECGLRHHIVTGAGQISNLIESLESIYQLPKERCIITTHANPDADALSSCMALHSHLCKIGIQSWIKICGDIPQNLENIIPEDIRIGKIPNVNLVVVLDSGPELERIGWEIPNNMKIFNIDHHISRSNLHNPSNNIFIIDMCSTAAILLRYFGIKDNILFAGIYGDTLFKIRIKEISQLLSTLDVDEETAEYMINMVDHINSKTVLSALRNSIITRYRNGFTVVELKDSIPAWAQTEVISILSKVENSVCLISESGSVRLRTTSKNIDVSQIASEFGGGGHKFAAGCFVNGNRTKLKKFLKSFQVESK